MGIATDAGLKWAVLTSKRPGLNRDLPPGREQWTWVANSSTLSLAVGDAILVDTFLTIEQIADSGWIGSSASGKNLVAIYITHGHGDHFFGLAPLLERFPRAKAVAVPEVVKAMRARVLPASIDGFWRKRFPAKFPTAC